MRYEKLKHKNHRVPPARKITEKTLDTFAYIFRMRDLTL